MKAVILGILTAVAIILLLLVASEWVQSEENKIIHTADITISGKVCSDQVASSTISKIQGTDGTVYFIPNMKCDSYIVGSNRTITYNHICNLPVREPGPLAYTCFNRSVGDYL